VRYEKLLAFRFRRSLAVPHRRDYLSIFRSLARSYEPRHHQSCQSHEKQIALGFKQYLQDSDEIYPPANSRWPAAIYVYTKTDQILRCPSVSGGNTGDIDYLYNANLAFKKDSYIHNSTTLILNAEAERGPATFGTQATAATRHDGGANYSFVDGHVKWLTPYGISANAGNGKPSFAIR